MFKYLAMDFSSTSVELSPKTSSFTECHKALVLKIGDSQNYPCKLVSLGQNKRI